jgi:hypothetical protein
MHNYETLFTENYQVQVILPMGATDIQVSIPFEVDEIDYSGKQFNTLDVFGAPKIVIKMRNVSSLLHKKDFEVTYRLESHWILAKPAMMACTVFVFYLFALAYSRVELQMEKKKID